MRAVSEEEVWEIATEIRYSSYDGNSISMIDHYYDKLLRLSVFPIRNEYFDHICGFRRKPLIDFIILFGITGHITIKIIEDFLLSYPK